MTNRGGPGRRPSDPDLLERWEADGALPPGHPTTWGAISSRPFPQPTSTERSGGDA